MSMVAKCEKVVRVGEVINCCRFSSLSVVEGNRLCIEVYLQSEMKN